MKVFGTAVTAISPALPGAKFVPGARADDWNRNTMATFSGPVEIPGVHLKGRGVSPAGAYVFKIPDSQSDRHIVQIFSHGGTTVYATMLQHAPAGERENAAASV